MTSFRERRRLTYYSDITDDGCGDEHEYAHSQPSAITLVRTMPRTRRCPAR